MGNLDRKGTCQGHVEDVFRAVSYQIMAWVRKMWRLKGCQGYDTSRQVWCEENFFIHSICFQIYIKRGPPSKTKRTSTNFVCF